MTPFSPKLAIRRCLSATARIALGLRSRPFPIEAAARTLILAPHQDDETLGCGGVIPQILAAGHRINVTYVTDGSASHPDHRDLAALRRAEAKAATTLLGIPPDQLEFLNARDGALARLSQPDAGSLAGQLTATLRRVQPTLVLLPCLADGSSEHEAAHGFFTRALRATGQAPRVLEFPVWSWWNPLLLRRSLHRSRQVWRASFPGQALRKQRALAAYATQVTPLPPDQSPMLSPAFISFFSKPEEFFFETA